MHCSIPEGFEAINSARLSGVDISAETCPQYLGLCEEDLYERGGIAKCDPPVRSKECVEQLWQCVLAGKVDMIASDHSQHPFSKKVVPADHFENAAEYVDTYEDAAAACPGMMRILRQDADRLRRQGSLSGGSQESC